MSSQLEAEALAEHQLDVLMRAKIGKQSELKKLIKVAQEELVPVEALILKSGMCNEDVLLGKLADAMKITALTPNETPKAHQQFCDLLGIEYIRRLGILPILGHEGALTLVTHEPLNSQVIETVQFVLGTPLILAVASKASIEKWIDLIFPTTGLSTPAGEIEDEDAIRAYANEGVVVENVQAIIFNAIQQSASDIHFEAAKDRFKIRFRINGVLKEQRVPDGVTENAVVSRLKYLAKLNISERRKPQDGRIGFVHSGREIDLRLSILPTQYGQSAVVRILDQNQVKLDWADLGFKSEVVQDIRKIITQPNGIFLVTGPTGSGKSTTLYTALSELNSPDRKIVTIEDPIEYNLAGINQVQVNSSVGLTFASALRSILRQDPDVILIGEIRDSETAEMACRAALVGRLVLSTLHTSSPEQARTRLKDLGVADYLVDATLKGVLGQKLEVKNCAECNGSGCTTCNSTGYGKRLLRYELLKTK